MHCKRTFRLTTSSFILSVVLAVALAGTALAAQGISLSATSGTVGSTLTVTGTEFSANTSADVTFGFGNSLFATNFPTTTGSGGGFSVSFAVPTVPGGTYTVSTTISGNTSSASFIVTPALTLDSTSMRVGDAVSVAGTGFSSSSLATTTTIYFDGTAVTSVANNANGTWVTSFAIPSAVYGSHTISANDGLRSASSTVTVTPVIALSPASGTIGSSTTIAGKGFRSGTTAAVNIRFDGNHITQVTPATDGTFSASIAIPESKAGSHTITAIDAVSGIATASATFTATPSIALSASSGAVESALTVTGKGFAANDEVSITMDGTQIATATTNSGGSFSASITVPAASGGARAIAASDGANSTTATFTILTRASITPTAGKVGSQISVIGDGFGAGSPVTVSFDEAPQVSVNADASGAVIVIFPVPASPAGAHTVTATDGTRSTSGTFTTQTNLFLSRNRGTAGAEVTIVGTGYVASGSVNIQMGNTAPKTVATDANGSFSDAFIVPQTDAGQYTIEAKDTTNAASAAFTVTASINASAAEGKVGSTVTVKGTGFSGTATIRFDGSAVATATAGANGAFSIEIAIPTTTRGAHTISVNDATTRLDLPFTVSSALSISPARGNVGSSITVSGTGFSGAVTVSYDNSTIAAATASSEGSFSATFTAPASLYGAHVIAASDAAVNLQATFVMESTAPSVPVLSGPQDTVRQNKQPTLTWGAVTDPSGVTYNLQVAADAGFSRLVIEKNGLTAVEYKVTDAEKLDTASKSKPYYWRVKAIDQAQNESDWSQPRTFYVTLLPPWVVWTGGVVAGLVALAFALKFGLRYIRIRQPL